MKKLLVNNWDYIKWKKNTERKYTNILIVVILEVEWL